MGELIVKKFVDNLLRIAKKRLLPLPSSTRLLAFLNFISWLTFVTWLYSDGTHPVLMGVGIGMCLSQVISLISRFIWHVPDVVRGKTAMAPSGKNNLDILAEHGLRVHYYQPSAGIEDPVLAEALRCFGSAGYVITDLNGIQLIGTVSSIPMNSNEIAEMRRAGFKIVSGGADRS
jgi:hypothetical protein